MKRSGWYFGAMVIGLWAFGVGAQDQSARTLNRSEDPVVVIADQLGPMQGEAVSGLALLR